MKMDSTMAVPPSSEPMEMVSSVIIVTSEAFRTLFIMMVVKGTPRALAPRTYSLLSSSRTVARTCRRYLADMAMARVSAGSATLCRLTPLEMTGNHPSRIANRYISSRDTKKFGSEFPIKLAVRIT